MFKNRNNIWTILLSIFLTGLFVVAFQIQHLNKEIKDFNDEIELTDYRLSLKPEKNKTSTTTETPVNTSQENEGVLNTDVINTKSDNTLSITPAVKTETTKIISVTPITKIDSLIINPDWQNINEKARLASVNIICTTPQGGLLNPISGSGVIISSKGVILTNAHLAQFFLLKKNNGYNFVDCVIRTGSPASPNYKAEIIYFPKDWLVEHVYDLKLESPKSTGEKDFAMLLITEHVNQNSMLPETFAHLEPATFLNTETINDPVLITAYPAGFLGGVTVQTNLYLSSAIANISDIYTFGSTTVDVISLSGNVAAQRGSSGGAVVNHFGKLNGLVVTTSTEEQTNDRSLSALTLSYINREIETDIGLDLLTFLNSDLKQKSEEFKQNKYPEFSKILLDELKRN